MKACKNDRKRFRRAAKGLADLVGYSSEPTRFLLIGNIPTNTSVLLLTAILNELKVELDDVKGTAAAAAAAADTPPCIYASSIVLQPGRPAALVGFGSQEQAKEACLRLHEQWCTEIRRLLCCSYSHTLEPAGLSLAFMRAENDGGRSGGGGSDSCASAASCQQSVAAVGGSAGGDGGAPRKQPPVVASEHFPAGLTVVHDIITEAEEAAVVETLQTAAWTELAKRKVVHYGHRFDYGTNAAASVGDDGAEVAGPNDGRSGSTRVEPFPPFCEWLIPRLVNGGVASPGGGAADGAAGADAGPAEKEPVAACEPLDGGGGEAQTTSRMKAWPDQLTVNEYVPGGGIPPHVDTHSAFCESIASVSLGSDVLMEFCPVDGDRETEKVCVRLPRRSLLVLNGSSRYAFTHMIATRKSDWVDGALQPRAVRTSLTFRSVQRARCRCAFLACCDHPRVAKNVCWWPTQRWFSYA